MGRPTRTLCGKRWRIPRPQQHSWKPLQRYRIGSVLNGVGCNKFSFMLASDGHAPKARERILMEEIVLEYSDWPGRRRAADCVSRFSRAIKSLATDEL